ncbi:MAG: protein kinase [Gemmatimonadota bacterium]|nr:protein kinase [Gemmatimonadota bacterium]
MTDIRDALQTQLGPTYTVERELGGGGMSRVFVAFDQALGRRVAVKVVSPELAASVHLERFMREILVAATLQNPHIVGVFTAGEVDGLPYFTMPYIEGESLRAHMVAAGQMPVREVVTILRDVARALAYAHERGIVHRDIKPDNVLLASGSAMVTDFGVAKAVLSAQRTPSGERSSVLTQVGTTVGTPAYMAPEQIAADPTVDARADVYSFGVMAYEMLAGGPPFASLTPQALLAAHLAKPPRPLDEARPGLPPRLVALVMQCLEKERDRRPQSAREIVDALDDPAIVSTDSLPARRRGGRRRLTGVVVTALLAVLASAAAYLGLRHRPDTALTSAAAASNPDSLKAHSVLVMPFVNVSTDSSDVYLADGITSELAASMTRIPGLRVAAVPPGTNGATPYRTQQELGATYKVGYVLEGTVQRQGSQLRITASLVNTADGFIVWSDVFDRTVRDVFTVQQDIARSIVNAVEPTLAPPLPQALAERGTRDDTAYEAYTRANGFITRRGVHALHRAIDTLAWAVRRDSTFAKAYAATARAYALLPVYGADSTDTVIARGIAAATRAIALDSSLADAYTARASLLNASFRWADAERDYRRAIAINPGDAAAHQGLGENLLLQGRVADAVAELKRASTLDPTSAEGLAAYAMALGISGDQTAALAAARHAMSVDSTVFVSQLALGAVQIFGGHPDSALAPLEAAGSLGTRRTPASPAVAAMLAYAYARVGDVQRAQNIAKAAITAKIPDAQVIAAHADLGAGNWSGALTALEAAARAHAPLLTGESLAEPIFDPLRADARFRALVRALGLPDTLAIARRSS